MQTIAITDYNQIHILERRDNVIYFRWDNEPRKHRAKIRQDAAGNEYFTSYHLSIRLDQHQPETKYYIAAYTGGGGVEYTRIFDDSINGYKPFDSVEQAQAYIDSGELDNYVYYPSYIIYTKIITAQEKEKCSPDYRNLWRPINKYPRGPLMGIGA